MEDSYLFGPADDSGLSVYEMGDTTSMKLLAADAYGGVSFEAGGYKRQNIKMRG